MPLTEKPILIVDAGDHSRPAGPKATLEGLGAECVIAGDVATAIRHLHVFDFAACLIGQVKASEQEMEELIHMLGGIPTFDQVKAATTSMEDILVALIVAVQGTISGRSSTA
jgi:hypothetical protein